jgi:hypothetical protein
MMPLRGVGNILLYTADIQKSKEGIEGYYRHAIKFNNVNGTMRIRNSLDIGKLKIPGTSFHRYLDDKRVYINKSQLGTKKCLPFGVDPQSTPCISFS